MEGRKKRRKVGRGVEYRRKKKCKENTLQIAKNHVSDIRKNLSVEIIRLFLPKVYGVKCQIKYL